MDRLIRTNPEYAVMAYRKALLGQCIAHLTRFTSSMGEAPREKVIAEEVIREESEVPEEEIQDFILGLEQERESLRLELAKFEFVKRKSNDQGKFYQKSEETSGQGKRHGPRNHGRSGGSS